MRRLFGNLILFVFGWKVSYPEDYRFPKMIVIAAPYTSGWDTLLSLSAYWKLNLYPFFMVNKRYTKGIVGYFTKRIGGLSIEPDNHRSLVDYSVRKFESSSEMLLIFAPEGRKESVERWRTGFFHIAKKAEVPICLSKLDYKNRIASIGAMLNMSGNFERDMNYIEKFYMNSNPKHPERYNTKIF